MATLSSFVTGQSIAASIEKTYIKAPDSLFSSLWVASGAGIAVSTETGAANLPEGSNKATALKILRASGSDYVRYRFKLDAADTGKTFKLFWNQIYGGSAGDYTISMFAYSDLSYSLNQTALTLDTSSVPSGTTSFYTTVAMPDFAVTPYIELRINGIAGTSPLYLSGIIVGPGNLMQGSAVTDWQSYTPTWTNITLGNGTSTGSWRRVGSQMEIRVKLLFGSTTSVTGLGVTASLPSGYNIDITTGLAPISSITRYGFSTLGDAGTGAFSAGVYQTGSSTTTVSILALDDTAAGSGVASVNLSATAPFTWAVGDTINAQFTIPVTEWIGSGTTLIGPSAQVEYVYNSSTATAASDTTSFASGSQGALIGAITANLERRVRFTYPIQNDDILIVELSEDRQKWQPLYHTFLNAANTQNIQSWVFQNGVEYGLGRLQFISSTDVDISFGQYAFAGSTYGAAGTTWSAAGGGSTYWRIRKAKAVAPVGISSSSGSGGSGFLISTKTSSFAAATLNHYLVDTSSAAITATLPAGATSATIKFSDDARTWATQLFTVQPATGEKIDGLGINESLICDVSGGAIQLSWDGTKWVLDTNAVGAGLIVQSSSSQMEKNYISKPDNANADWTTSNVSLVTVATESTVGNLPENATKTTAIRITRVSGTTGYVYIRMVLDTVDANKKLKLQWNQKYAGSAGDYTIQVFSFTASDYTTGSSQISVASSSIPSGNSTFLTTFDSPASTAPYIELRIVAAAGTTPLYLSGVSVGPGLVQQTVALSDWQSYTPAVTAMGTGPTIAATWRRVGSSMEINFRATLGTAPAAGFMTFALPTGFTIDFTALPSASSRSGGVFPNTVGSGMYYKVSTENIYSGNIQANSDQSSLLYFGGEGGVSNWTILGAPTAPAASDRVSAFVSIPIAQWTGSGTINIGQGAQEEYLSSTTGTWDAAAAAGNTVYGPAGSPISGTLTALRSKVCRLQSPLQITDRLQLQYQLPSSGGWVDSEQSAYPFVNWPVTLFGGYISAATIGSTDVTVTFGQFAIVGTTYNTTTGAANWLSSVYPNWRLVRYKSSVPIGFGLADATNSGLLSTTTQTIAGPKTFTSEMILGPTGSSSSSLFHRINIPSVTSYNYSISQTYGLLGAFTANSGLGILGNAHNTLTTGLSLDAAVHDTNTGTPDMIFRVRENDNTDFATLTNAAFSWRRFGTEIGSITRSGALTMGPSTGAALTHIFTSGADTTVRINAQTGANPSLRFSENNVAQWTILNINTSDALWINNAAGTTLCEITQGGAWAIGNSTSVAHAISGRVAVTANAASTYAFTIENTSGTDSSTSALRVTTNTASSARIISAQNAGTERFAVTGAGDVLFGNNGNTSSVSAAGAWTKGPTSGLTATHTIQTDNTAIITLKRTAAGRPHIIFKTSDDTNRGYIGCDSGGFVLVNGAGSAVNFAMTDAGLATVGPSGQTGTHNFNGAIVATGNITAFSDARLKTDIETITGALTQVEQLRGVSYTKDGQRGVGFLAQEILEVLPEVVQENQNGFLSVAYGNVTALLVEAVKELSQEVKDLRKKLDEAS